MPARKLALILALVIAAAALTVAGLQAVIGPLGANPVALVGVGIVALVLSFLIRRVQ